MSKKNQNVDAIETPATEPVATVVATEPENYLLRLHRADHPGDRSSYTVDGRPGNVVFFNSLFLDGKPPATIMLDVALVAPKADNKELKAQAAAEKAAERARKAQEKVEAAARKQQERAAKAAEKLAAAQAKIDAAKATTSGQ